MNRPHNLEAAHAEIIGAITRRLTAAGIGSAPVDARWLIEHVIEVAGDPAGPGAATLDALVARREAREPLQLVLGTWSFRTVELLMRPGVFIPRPETEIVAGVAIDAARDAGTAPLIVEPCTGTGAIACALLAEVPGAQIVAIDVDPDAVALATDNLARVGAGAAGPPGAASGAQATVLHGDLLGPLDPARRGHVDVLVANPPYLPEGDRDQWEPEVAHHDPDTALVGGPDGHEIVDALLADATQWLAPGGVVVLEIDERRGSEAVACAEHHGLVGVHLVRDLTGADRAVVASRAIPISR